MSQDWEPLIIKKNKNKETEKTEHERLLKDPSVKKEQLKKVKTQSFSQSLTQDGEIPKLTYVSNDMKFFIRKSRLEKNMSQEQLAKTCNLDKNIISDIENPITKVLYSPYQINTIAKALHVNIPRK